MPMSVICVFSHSFCVKIIIKKKKSQNNTHQPPYTKGLEFSLKYLHCD